MAKTIGLVLSGCGVYDGSEIHEAVLSLLALERRGYTVQCLAPNCRQVHVVDHFEGRAVEEPEQRNVLVESARIARGKIKAVEEISGKDFDGLFFPGGFGAAKNLSTFAFDGPKAVVNEDVARLITECHAAHKPMVFLCISPAICARVLGNGAELTIGDNPGVAGELEKMGAKHIVKRVDEAHTDRKNLVVSSPAYMYDISIVEVEKSVAAAVAAFAELLG